MIVKPATPGTVIRDPRTKRRLPDEGARVPRSSFWLRRLAQKDVVLVPEPVAAPAKARKPAGGEG